MNRRVKCSKINIFLTEYYREGGAMNKQDLDVIKYDLKETLIYRELTVAAFLLFVIDATIFPSSKNIETAIYSFYSLPIFFVLMVGLAGLYGVRRNYMKRLSYAGYLICYSKKDYKKSLDELEKFARKKYEVCLTGGKKYLAVAAIVITSLTGIAVFTLTKVVHPIVFLIMVVFTVYYIVKANQYFYKEESDEKAGNSKKIKLLYIIKLVEFIAIYGVLLVNILVVDYHINISEPSQYERAMRYYKWIDAERYRLFPNEIPEEAFILQDVYMEDREYCYVYFYGPEEMTEEYRKYYANLDESVVIHTQQDSEEYDLICSKIISDLEDKMGHEYWSENATIYEFDKWLPAESENGTEYYSMYVMIEWDRVIIGFSL